MEIKPNKRAYENRKVDKALLDRILKDIEEGSTNEHAAESNRISESHFYFMLQQGRCDLDHEVDSLYAYLVEGLRKIEQKEIKWARGQIKMSPKSHAGAEWTLEHAYWRHFCGNAALLELEKQVKDLVSSWKKE